MLLKYTDTSNLTKKDSIDFFNKNERDIMSIFSQYATMFPEENNETLALYTMLYMLIGKDSSVPDQSFEIDDDQENEIQNEFCDSLYYNILLAIELMDMVKEGLLEASRDDAQECIKYKLTPLGEKMAQELLKEEN